MKSPKLSICVPNLNTLPFLPERFETIFNQTFQDWELLVYDSHSADGAWEYICQLAEHEPRMRVWQGPREGTPGSWSPCVREATGEYVYIATSDDTMPPDCLEKLVNALEQHPECDLAHCTLRAIDDKGRETPDWWSPSSIFARSSGEFLHCPHIRRAPFDGLLHLLGHPVYISITQLLMRRSLFERIGLFESRWGPAGDFNWSMRAGLVASTMHVPDTWGGWRIHGAQATGGAAIGSLDHRQRIESMIEHAIDTCEKFLSNSVRQPLTSRWLRQMRDLRGFLSEVECRPEGWPRKAFVLWRFAMGSWAARQYVKSRLPGRQPWPEAAPDFVRNLLEDVGIDPVLVPV